MFSETETGVETRVAIRAKCPLFSSDFNQNSNGSTKF